LLGLPLRDLVDAAYRLFTIWCCQTHQEKEQLDRIDKHFRDAETEWETGVPVLPGWAALGNVAAQYGLDDADPFATPPEDPLADN
jgi:hypothetical protein